MGMEFDVDAIERAPPVDRICRYLSERSPQAMIAVDGLTHIVSYLNPAFAQLVGKERKGLVGRRFADAVPEGEENGCLALLDRVFQTKKPENLAEQEHRQTQPRAVFWSYAVWAILGDDDTPAGVMIQVTDASETALFRRQLVAMNEALLISATRQHELAAAAESLSARLQTAVLARDHFLAILSHELRNPLSAMTNGMQLLKRGGDDPAKAESTWSMMDRQLNQTVRLVDDLLDVSRIAGGKIDLHKERVDLAMVVRDAVEACRPLIDRGRHELTITAPSAPMLADVDPSRLAQVFLNLLNNAAKYSEPGGRILLSLNREGNEAVVRVKDSGIGIPASHLPHVFEIFVQVDAEWRRAQGGFGIGLSLVKEFVELHGGRVEARSEGPGKGSEFIVRLPLEAATSAAAPPAFALEKPHGPRRRILVVDDNRDVAESLAQMLEILDHDVYTAFGGVAGVAAAAEFRPEVILMDLGMPNVDGCEAARRIRAEVWGSEPFLVALTGRGADDDRQRTHDAGFDRHLVKPVRLDALQNLFTELPNESS